jgi:hypothetical protein
MAGKVIFVPDPEGIAILAEAPGMVESMDVFAQEAAMRTRELVPIGEDTGSDARWGHYHDQVTVDVGIDDTPIAGLPGPHAVARVNANKFTAHWLEFGTVNMRALAPLRRGAEAAGLTVIDK